MKPLLPTAIILLLLLHLYASHNSILASPEGLQTLNPGDSLSVEDEATDFLISPDGAFSAGFYKVGTNAYCFSIWFTHSADKTVTWMANRDNPVNGKSSKLTLYKEGNLVLTDADGTVTWYTDTFSHGSPVSAQLLETGNLVLTNQTSVYLWESFSSPTDTLLPSQLLTKTNMLISMRGPETYLSGYYNFHFNDNNILSLVYNGPEVSSVYWPNPDVSVFTYGRTPYNSSRSASFDEFGHFNSSDNLNFNPSDYGLGPKRRLTLGYDGILRLHSLDEKTGLWIIVWLPAMDTCNVNGLCGAYGICVYVPALACACPPGFHVTDPSDWSKGCSPDFSLDSCNPKYSDFIQLFHTDYYGYDLVSYGTNLSFEACRNSCLNDCNCKGFGYLAGQGQCYPKSILLNGYQMPNYPRNMHIKVAPKTLAGDNMSMLIPPNLNCSGNTELVIMDHAAEGNDRNLYLRFLIGFVVAVGIVESLCIGVGWWYINRINEMSKVADMGYHALTLVFKRFTYKELKMATRNFRDEIGRGGFGTVYKGVLDDGRVVAVKRLEGISQGETEFWAEVSIIGRINHRNLVKMLGFCAEEKNRLLVYEYMENGSLDRVLFSGYDQVLKWRERFEIAMGTAKGLAYLHEECLEWVLHCDIKPQNILLDENLHPKVADFGMSKLVDNKSALKSNFSRVRGTRGYLAPEWMLNQEITAKADVYSYGVVLLELVTGKSAISGDHEGDDEYNHLVEWVMEKVKQSEGMRGVVDSRMNGEYDGVQLEKVVQIALLCLAENKGQRPAMSQIVRLILGDENVF